MRDEIPGWVTPVLIIVSVLLALLLVKCTATPPVKLEAMVAREEAVASKEKVIANVEKAEQAVTVPDDTRTERLRSRFDAARADPVH